MSTTVAVVLAAVVGGLVVVNRSRHVDEHGPIAIPERVELTGQTGVVGAIDISADGLLVAAADETTVRIWDSLTGRELRQITPDTKSPISAVAFSSDGRVVGAHLADGQAQFWDVADGHTAAPFSASWDDSHYSPMDAQSNTVLSPDGKTAVKLSRFSGAVLRDVATGTWLHQLQAGGTAWTAAFSSDGTTLAVKFDRAVRLWRLVPFEELPAVSFPALQGTADRMEFSPDGKRIAFTVGNKVIIQRIGATT
jgi:WD40 repeat protein